MDDNNGIEFMMKLEKARNAVRFSFNQIAAEYDMPGYMLDMVIYSVLSEELQQRISMMSEMINIGEGPEPTPEPQAEGGE